MDNDVLNFTYFSKIYFEDIFINSYLYFYRDKLYAFARKLILDKFPLDSLVLESILQI